MTAQEIQRSLAALATGKTTTVDNGGGSATITFRNPADTVDAIVATMQDRDRESVTLDVSE